MHTTQKVNSSSQKEDKNARRLRAMQCASVETKQCTRSIGCCCSIWEGDGRHLSCLVAEDNDGAAAAAPGRDGGARGPVDVGEVGGAHPPGGDECQRHAADPAVALARDHQQGGRAQDAPDGARVAALEQSLLVLQHQLVELLVARHHRRRAEQVRLEHRAVPASCRPSTVAATARVRACRPRGRRSRETIMSKEKGTTTYTRICTALLAVVPVFFHDRGSLTTS